MSSEDGDVVNDRQVSPDDLKSVTTSSFEDGDVVSLDDLKSVICEPDDSNS